MFVLIVKNHGKYLMNWDSSAVSAVDYHIFFQKTHEQVINLTFTYIESC